MDLVVKPPQNDALHWLRGFKDMEEDLCGDKFRDQPSFGQLEYVHGLAARGVHYLHRPGPTLQDLGFFILPASQTLRIFTFYSTQLPGPNYHCRAGAIYGCGDLIFSSHMIFTLVFVLTYQKYGTRRCIKQFGWLVAIIQSFLIVASRKHYTVDVVVAWYTVNLVVFFVDKRLPELPDRTNGSYPLLLPLSAKDKDNKTKEENHKLLNRNSLTLQIGGREVKAMARFWKTAMQTRWILQ
ncbi:hypothetical protein V6N11_039576 [Hibiscus sabdariffa]|uniref:Sphingomyelin synthase-like domain-containing protein n=1 Tax=Hibiscus sabdariffa TaxID=183260 RepID=A0ABR2SNA6_9ROSI